MAIAADGAALAVAVVNARLAEVMGGTDNIKTRVLAVEKEVHSCRSREPAIDKLLRGHAFYSGRKEWVKRAEDEAPVEPADTTDRPGKGVASEQVRVGAAAARVLELEEELAAAAHARATAAAAHGGGEGG